MTETTIDGDTFNVIAEGKTGAPVILLAHSLGTNLHVFDRQVAALSPHFQVIRFDARGHGGSRVSMGPYSIEQLGNDALAILDSLAIDRAHFVGLSAGGLVGLWLLRHAPERIVRAVLANTAAQMASPDFWNERIRVVRENGIGALAPTIIENWFTRQFREQHPEDVNRFEQALFAMSGEGYAAAAAAVRDADFRAELADIDHPVLVIVGKHDPMTPPGIGALIASSIPSAKTVTLEAAHLSPVEAAEAFNDAVLEFLLGPDEKPAEAGAPAETAAAIRPPMPRKPRVPKPKPAPAAEAARDAPAATEAPKHRPRAAPKPKPPEPIAAPAPASVVAPARKAAAKKSAPKKAVPKKAATKKRRAPKKAVQRPARKALTKKRVTRKAAVKKKLTRKAVAKKRPAKKTIKKATRKMAPKKTTKKAFKKFAAKKSRRALTKRRSRR